MEVKRKQEEKRELRHIREERVGVEERKEEGGRKSLPFFISNWEYRAILQVCFDYHGFLLTYPKLMLRNPLGNDHQFEDTHP